MQTRTYSLLSLTHCWHWLGEFSVTFLGPCLKLRGRVILESIWNFVPGHRKLAIKLLYIFFVLACCSTSVRFLHSYILTRLFMTLFWCLIMTLPLACCNRGWNIFEAFSHQHSLMTHVRTSWASDTRSLLCGLHPIQKPKHRTFPLVEISRLNVLLYGDVTEVDVIRIQNLTQTAFCKVQQLSRTTYRNVRNTWV